MSETQTYDGRYIVVGPPGTGKTTFLSKQVGTIVEKFNAGMIANWETPVLVCSLTKAAAAEIGGRDMPVEKGAVGTLHSHCFQLLGRPKILTRADVLYWNMDYPTQLQVEKFPKPQKQGGEGLEDPHASAVAEDARVVTGAVRAGQDLYDRCEIARHRMTPSDHLQADEKQFLDEWTAFKKERNVVDFTDLIYNAMFQTDHAPAKPWVILVDEAQDLSRLEDALLKRWGERAAATILVGDPLQTIYGFRGSDPALFHDPDVPESHHRVLSQSYRVPKRVLEASVYWIRGQLGVEPAEYKPRPDPFEPEKPYDGSVEVREYNYELPGPLVNEILEIIKRDPTETIMIQATCSYMLNGIVGELRYHGVPFANPWKRNRGDWNPLREGENSTANKLAVALTTCKDSPEIRPWSYVAVARFLSMLKAKGVVASGKMKRVLDLCKTYEAHPEATPTEHEIVEWFGEGGFLHRTWLGEVTEREFMDWWYAHRKKPISEPLAQYLRYVVQRCSSEGLRKPPRVYIGTVHSFKGSEAGVVFVFPDLSPTAHSHWGRGGSPVRAEIVRQFYVAMTRSQERLIICRAASIRCAPLRREVSDWIGNGGGGG